MLGVIRIRAHSVLTIMAFVNSSLVTAILGLVVSVVTGQCSALPLEEQGITSIICVSDKETAFSSRCQNSTSNCSSWEEIEEVTRRQSSVKVVFLVSELSLNKSVDFHGIRDISFIASSCGTIINCSGSRQMEEKEAGISFTGVSDLLLLNITFLQCAAKHHSTTFLRGSTNTTALIWSAVYILNSTTIRLLNVVITQSPGKGLVLYDTNGTVELINCTFSYNTNTTSLFLGGGGVYVEFTRCSPGMPTNCQNFDSVTFSQYRFHNCTFVRNRASLGNQSKSTSLHNTGRYFQGMGKGGAICIYMNDGAVNNTFEITDSHFIENSAAWGGALYISLHGNSFGNHITVSRSDIKGNTVLTKGGGGVAIGYSSTKGSSPNRNNISFHDCSFAENKAAFGGGTAIHTSRRDRQSNVHVLNSIEFVNCKWVENTARFGSAVDISPHIWDTLQTGEMISIPVFTACRFIGNKGVPKRQYNNNHTSWLSYQLPKGAFAVTGFVIRFVGRINFTGNNCSGLYLVSSIVIFDQGTNAIFDRNEGLDGGAIALMGFSSIQLGKDSFFHFRENRAVERGGAISVTSIDYHDFLSTRSCFMQYVGEHLRPKNVTFFFEQNTVVTHARSGGGNSIYVTSVLPCFYACHPMDENAKPTPESTFECLGDFSYKMPGTMTDEIGTAIETFRVEGMPLVIPGEQFRFPFAALNNYGKEMISVYQAHIDGDEDEDKDNNHPSSIRVRKTHSFVYNKTMDLYGKPGSKDRISLYQQGTHGMVVSMEVQMEECPPGYILMGEDLPECVCSYTANDTYQGVYKCDSKGGYHASLARGFWMGYDDKICKGDSSEREGCLLTSHCSTSFCFANSRDPYYPLPSRANSSALDRTVCGEERTGTLCGNCRPGYSVFYHHHTLKCQKNRSCKLGWFLYILSELVPLTILFALVMALNINFTSGALNGFILFIQIYNTLDTTSQGALFIPNDEVWALTKALRFLYKFFNLDFFSIAGLSFCLWSNADALDILSFKYVTMAYALLLIIAVIALMRYAPFYRLCTILTPRRARQSVIHGLTAFLVMCYSQCTEVTFKILQPSVLYAINHVAVRTVPLYNGELDYFRRKHLFYAIPALICLVFILVLPPIFLLIHPVSYKLLAILRLNESAKIARLARWIPFHKLKPLLDSFQSCFKDDMRFFAGLYFVYRLFALMVHVLARSPGQFYSITSLLLTFMLIFHAIAQPYRVHWHNAVDTLFFGGLALINSFTLLNLTHNLESQRKTTLNGTASIQLIIAMMPLVYVMSYTVSKVTVLFYRKFKARQSRASPIDENELPARLLNDNDSDFSIYRSFQDEAIKSND